MPMVPDSTYPVDEDRLPKVLDKFNYCLCLAFYPGSELPSLSSTTLEIDSRYLPGPYKRLVWVDETTKILHTLSIARAFLPPLDYHRHWLTSHFLSTWSTMR